MAAVYAGLVFIVVLSAGLSTTAPDEPLTAFAARYISLLLSALPLIVAASVWTATTGLIAQHAGSVTMSPTAQQPLALTWVRACLRPLPIDARLAPQRESDPISVAFSSAFHPVTIVAIAVTFGARSGLLLFFLVFASVAIFGAGLLWKRVVRHAAAGSPNGAAAADFAPGIDADGLLPLWSETASSELYHRLRLTILGLLVAVAAHVLMPQPVVRLLVSAPAIGVAAAAALALLLSIPAEAAPFAAALFLGTVSHGAVLAFVLVSAVGGGRTVLTALRTSQLPRAAATRGAAVFMLAALTAIMLLAIPITDLATGALW